MWLRALRPRASEDGGERGPELGTREPGLGAKARPHDLPRVNPQRRVLGEPQLERVHVVLDVAVVDDELAERDQRLRRRAEPHLLGELARRGVARLLSALHASTRHRQPRAVGGADQQQLGVHAHEHDGSGDARPQHEVARVVDRRGQAVEQPPDRVVHRAPWAGSAAKPAAARKPPLSWRAPAASISSASAPGTRATTPRPSFAPSTTSALVSASAVAPSPASATPATGSWTGQPVRGSITCPYRCPPISIASPKLSETERLASRSATTPAKPPRPSPSSTRQAAASVGAPSASQELPPKSRSARETPRWARSSRMRSSAQPFPTPPKFTLMPGWSTTLPSGPSRMRCAPTRPRAVAISLALGRRPARPAVVQSSISGPTVTSKTPPVIPVRRCESARIRASAGGAANGPRPALAFMRLVALAGSKVVSTDSSSAASAKQASAASRARASSSDTSVSCSTVPIEARPSRTETAPLAVPAPARAARTNAASGPPIRRGSSAAIRGIPTIGRAGSAPRGSTARRGSLPP